jgi:hypothetical protein
VIEVFLVRDEKLNLNQVGGETDWIKTDRLFIAIEICSGRRLDIGA